jgi:anaerobic C4-dicarboxylate transporter
MKPIPGSSRLNPVHPERPSVLEHQNSHSQIRACDISIGIIEYLVALGREYDTFMNLTLLCLKFALIGINVYLCVLNFARPHVRLFPRIALEQSSIA